MRMSKNYAGIPYLYRQNGAVSTVMKITMKEPVDGKLLQSAVNFTVARHPYFKSSLLEQNGDFYIAENEMPFVVAETTEYRCLGSKDLNFHMIDVTYYGNDISVAFHHALCDGIGAKKFVQTLLCYYCEFRYQDNIELDDESTLQQPGEILDPFDHGMYPVENVPMPHVIKDGYALLEIPATLSNDTDYMVVFTLDNNVLMHVAKKNHASPAVLIALLVSKAIQSVRTDADKPVVCSMASNLRQALNTPHTLKNTVNSIYLPYDAVFGQLSLEQQSEKYKAMIAEQKEENYVRTCANSTVYLFSKLDEMKTYEEKKKVMAMFDSLKIDTYILSYAGRLHLKNAERYIQSVQLFSGGNNGMILNMMAVGDTLTINILQSFKSDVYVKAFEKLLKDTELVFTVSEQTGFTTPRDKIATTPALESVRDHIDPYAYVQSLNSHPQNGACRLQE